MSESTTILHIIGQNQHSGTYVLGHSDAELERLMAQSRLLGDLTEQILRQAGLEPGMRVLDLGCGPGDVSFLAASMVGSSGSVHGVDTSPEAIALARERASLAGLSNVSFEIANLADFRLAEPVDAIVGRLVLMYLPDPAAVLRRLTKQLSAGGLVAFQEIDISSARSLPEFPLYRTCGNWIWETFHRAGLETDMGSRLYSTFRRAGLPNPEMLLGARVGAGPDSPVYEYLAQTVRSLVPMMERFEVVSANVVGIDSLADRLREEAMELDAVLIMPSLIGAWTRKPA